MTTSPARQVVFGLLIVAALALPPGNQALAQPEYTRVPWKTSKVHGSPEPPLPYRLERVFPKVGFKKLTHVASAPGMKRLFVTTETGQLFSFNPDAGETKADPFLNLPRDVKSCQPGMGISGFDQLYSLVFHPKFAENRYVYVCYSVQGTQGKSVLRNPERVSRFTVDNADPPRAEPGSEKIILEWLTERGGHNGACLCFGPDGCLYISMGDAAPPSPPDRHKTGQDLSDLLASILRIDVDHVEGDKAYKVPADNPFVKTPGARPEIWAYGLRNPWKMSFDRVTGELWTGDVGWEMWEMVYRVRKGGNYGWSIVEGPQSIDAKGKRGPTPILPPALSISHAEGASVTGGYVYRGKRFPELVGSYIFGDWMTGRIWSTRFDGDRVVAHKEVARGLLKIIAFHEDGDGELLVAGYGDQADGLYQLVPNKASDTVSTFPRKLSETGLVASAAQLAPAAGVYTYAILTEPWQDHATAERLVALPDLSTVNFSAFPMPVPNKAFFSSRLSFPKDAVLAKTLSIEMERGKTSSKRRLETQILHFDGVDWWGYSYRWNDAQTDADLVPAGGAEMELDIRDAEAPEGKRQQTWRFPSRTQCLICHNGWVGPPLAFTPEQLNRGEQLDQFHKRNLIAAAAGKIQPKGPANAKVRALFTLADPHDTTQDVAKRARSYLHVNCAHCHQNAAGGTATIDLRAGIDLNAAKAINAVPLQGSFNMPDARLLTPGDPFRSVLYYRLCKTGPGRMPHIGSEIVDVQGVEVIHDWIRSLVTKGKGGDVAAYKGEKAALELLAASKNPAKDPALQQLLASTPGSLMLARALEKKAIPAKLSGPVVAAAAARPESEIRDLFERFLPADQRVKRLGTSFNAKALLALQGNAERGRAIFFQTAGLQCATCHKVGAVGGEVGPDLAGIGKKYDRIKILESIVDPSKDVEPAYVSHAVQHKDGRVVIGLIVRRNDKEFVLRDAQAKEHRFVPADVEAVTPQRPSIMPEQLLRDMTPQQAADLLEFLSGLKEATQR